MPRKIRKPSQSKVYHVMVRGNERKRLFIDEEDKTRFIEILNKIAGEWEDEKIQSSALSSAILRNKEKEFFIYAYCLMDNHVHLLINEGEDKISRIMKRIGTRYASYFNRKYTRTGHLFQDRFKSEAVETDAYLLSAVRYIHSNPVKAYMVEHPSQYPWSSYNEYISEDRKVGLIQKDMVLGILSEDRKRAIELFIEYSGQLSEDEFIEYKEMEVNKTLISINDVKDYVEKYLREEGVELSEINNKEKINVRNKLIAELKEKSNLSVRQIAGMLGINRGVVQRIKP